MTALVLGLYLLACPLSMLLMMWLMRRRAIVPRPVLEESRPGQGARSAIVRRLVITAVAATVGLALVLVLAILGGREGSASSGPERPPSGPYRGSQPPARIAMPERDLPADLAGGVLRGVQIHVGGASEISSKTPAVAHEFEGASGAAGEAAAPLMWWFESMIVRLITSSWW